MQSPTKQLGFMVIGLKGTILTKLEQKILNEYMQIIGGIILFSRNFRDQSTLIDLIRSIRDINQDWIIMVDHEGGSVWRFEDLAFPNPGAMRTLGELYNKEPLAAIDLAYKRGQAIAKDLVACDIDVNLAPVLDLDYNGISTVIANRAIHNDPEVVALLAAQFIQGQASVGIKSVGKHFPGHGAIQADTHLTQGTDPRSQDLIFAQDILPFTKLINGDDKLSITPGILPGIMPAHIIYPAVDSVYPAGFSKLWLQKILRVQLKFNGVVISDCLSMQAAQEFVFSIQKHHPNSFPLTLDLTKSSPQQQMNLWLIQQALHAGCDLVIFNQIHEQALQQLLLIAAAEIDLGSLADRTIRNDRIRKLLRKY